MTPEAKAKLADLLLGRSEVAETGCRRWTGSRNHKGYGRIGFGGRSYAVHRAAFEVWVGPIPDGLEIDHVRAAGCRYRDCIEPAHLEAVTRLENLRRKPQPTHCPKNHEYTPENTVLIGRSDRPGVARRCRVCLNDRERRKYARQQREKAQADER